MLIKLFKIKPEVFFIYSALFFAFLLNIVTPPLQAPDELNHFYRAYQIADGYFLPERTVDRLGGQIPVSFEEYIEPFNNAATNLKYTFDKKDILKSLDVQFDGELTEFKDFPSTASYSPVSYFPQVIGMFLVKQFTCNVAALYYAGRLFSFIFWLVTMFFVIRLLPIYKWLFTLIILLPMNLYVTCAFSADGVNNCLTFLFLALVLKHIFSENKITKKDLFAFFIILSFLALAKFIYIIYIVLLILIPANNFKSNKHRFGSFLIIFSIIVFVFIGWSRVYMANSIKISEYNQDYIYNVGLSPCADYVAQKEYILTHGFYFFKVIYHSIFNHPQTFLKSYIGVFGQSDVFIPNWVYVLSYLTILFIAISESNKIVLVVKQKAVLFFVAFSAFSLILLSIHLMWDCVGEGVVDIVQGRYLIPIFPLLFILFSNGKFRLNYHPIIFILPFILLIYFYSFKVIYERFFVESFSSKIEFYCDAEKIDENGLLYTSNAEIKLENGNLQTLEEHVSGNHSIQLSPSNQYGFTYKFKNLSLGDLVEIEVFKKGGPGQLVVAGKGEGCQDFFINNKSPKSNDWRKMKFVFTMTKNCTNSDVTFFVWNPNDEKNYFDDIKFCIKKFN
ncbi:MAG: DUF2142 domain-containing protein [Bacteroidota bacterium]|nr:DUF2142 domain-containing protein [Bacteroidota bacterium]MDP3144695.1 DUF2142 domain-containing protein [Bacteroidota bacterium]MDP3557932.1 DUF2142 domain-containing protein [Bacteroidota bacterium]